MRPRVVAVAVTLAVAAGLVASLVAAGDRVRRPEGAAERYLHALSNARDVGAWGEPDLGSELTGFEADDDTLFATIEVGRAALDGQTATIPARIVRNDAEGTDVSLELTARRAREGSPPGWRVVALRPVASAAVPSAGGAQPARVASVVWPAVALAALALAAAADILVTRLRRRSRSAASLEPSVSEIGYEELVEKLATGGIVLIDAQAPGWFEREHLPGAQPIDWHGVAASAARIIPSPDSEVAVYCWNTTCTGSEVIGDELVRLGYQRVRRYVGGKQDWADNGGPLDTPAAAGER